MLPPLVALMSFEYLTIATTGNNKDFGDLTDARRGNLVLVHLQQED